MTELTNHGLFERARRVIPGGVNSPVRAFGSVGGDPYFVSHAEGPHLWDVEGRRYIDLVQSYGAIMLGHANPGVVDAVCVAAADGTSFGAPTPGEVRLAELICERVAVDRPGPAGVERDRGHHERHPHGPRVHRAPEAGEVRRQLPRALRRPAGGGGHGHGLVGPARLGRGDRVGRGRHGGRPLQRRARPSTSRPRAVIVEPIAANMGLVPPVPGFLEGLRAECDRVGALLIFDEVITGFRVAAGGAQALSG